jgi:hypothetical protein
MGKRTNDDLWLPGDEAANRRDEVVRRMANTPPQPRVTTSIRRPKRRKKTALGRGARKDRATHEL